MLCHLGGSITPAKYNILKILRTQVLTWFLGCNSLPGRKGLASLSLIHRLSSIMRPERIAVHFEWQVILEVLPSLPPDWLASVLML